MRSLELIGKWCWQCVQTLRFSSSSLSKTIVEHFGHLVHKPSGISRFFDFAVASFGFLGKLEFGIGAGGVTAGSPDSNFNAFLVKEVAMLKHFENAAAWT
jgi:hypothetical protein